MKKYLPIILFILFFSSLMFICPSAKGIFARYSLQLSEFFDKEGDQIEVQIDKITTFEKTWLIEYSILAYDNVYVLDYSKIFCPNEIKERIISGGSLHVVLHQFPKSCVPFDKTKNSPLWAFRFIRKGEEKKFKIRLSKRDFDDAEYKMNKNEINDVDFIFSYLDEQNILNSRYYNTVYKGSIAEHKEEKYLCIKELPENLQKYVPYYEKYFPWKKTIKDNPYFENISQERISAISALDEKLNNLGDKIIVEVGSITQRLTKVWEIEYTVTAKENIYIVDYAKMNCPNEMSSRIIKGDTVYAVIDESGRSCEPFLWEAEEPERIWFFRLIKKGESQKFKIRLSKEPFDDELFEEDRLKIKKMKLMFGYVEEQKILNDAKYNILNTAISIKENNETYLQIYWMPIGENYVLLNQEFPF